MIKLGPRPPARSGRDFALDWIRCLCQLGFVLTLLAWPALDAQHREEYQREHRHSYRVEILPAAPIMPADQQAGSGSPR